MSAVKYTIPRTQYRLEVEHLEGVDWHLLFSSGFELHQPRGDQHARLRHAETCLVSFAFTSLARDSTVAETFLRSTVSVCGCGGCQQAETYIDMRLTVDTLTRYLSLVETATKTLDSWPHLPAAIGVNRLARLAYLCDGFPALPVSAGYLASGEDITDERLRLLVRQVKDQVATAALGTGYWAEEQRDQRMLSRLSGQTAGLMPSRPGDADAWWVLNKPTWRENPLAVDRQGVATAALLAATHWVHVPGQAFVHAALLPSALAFEAQRSLDRCVVIEAQTADTPQVLALVWEMVMDWCMDQDSQAHDAMPSGRAGGRMQLMAAVEEFAAAARTALATASIPTAVAVEPFPVLAPASP